MSKYLKYYSTKSSAISAEDIIAPNVTYCLESEQVLISNNSLATGTSLDIVADGDDKIKYATPPQPETWIFNATPDITVEHEFTVSFTMGGQECGEIKVGPEGTMMFEPGISYSKTNPWYPFDVYDEAGWVDQSYRVITFPSAPTGDLLTYLQANAKKVGEFIVNYGGDITLNFGIGSSFTEWIDTPFNIEMGGQKASIDSTSAGNCVTWGGNSCLQDGSTIIYGPETIIENHTYTRAYAPS